MSLEDRLATMIECTRVCFDNAAHADEGDVQRFLETFTEKATLTVDGERFDGREAIGDSFKSRQSRQRRVHVVSNVRIDPLDDSTSEGNMYVAAYDAPETEDRINQAAALFPWIIGRYQDRYIRTPSGWKISSRIFETLM